MVERDKAECRCFHFYVEAQVGYSIGMSSEPRPFSPADDLRNLASFSSSLPRRSPSFADGLAVSLGPTLKLRDPARCVKTLRNTTRAEDCAGHTGYDSLIRPSSPLCLLPPFWLLFFCPYQFWMWADEPAAAFVDGFGMLCLFWGEHMAVRVMVAD